MNDLTTPRWRSQSKLLLVGFIAIGGYLLWTEHQAHVIASLPWVLIFLGCVGMHLFMHGGHGHGRDHVAEHRRKNDRGSER